MNISQKRFRWRLALLFMGFLSGHLGASMLAATSFPAADLEFFEKRIRPVLASACFDCHSRGADKLKGGLLLDTRDDLLAGGDSGPAAEVGKPTESRLLRAIGYGDVDLQMPPKSKLSDAQIEDFRVWIANGLAWPEEAAPTGAARKDEFDLAARKSSHWSWQPVGRVEPPQVKNSDWVRNPVDAFILRQLEDQSLAPAGEASRRSLIRRLSYGLTGLPPKAADVSAFERAYNRQSYEQIVDRLLATPQFGERWARHWLDLVRFAETMGHEFDYAIPNAWRYRDYLVRAFNQDVPYDQFAWEHLAGDLIEHPRRWAENGFNESVVGTGFYWLGQQVHSPVDIEMNQLEVIDNQIDVLTKTFLGMTVSCARCHDHKFDAISTKDFYALYGVLSSSRYHEAVVDEPKTWERSVAKLDQEKKAIRVLAGKEWAAEASRLKAYALAGIGLLADEMTKTHPVAVAQPDVVFANFESTLDEGWEGDRAMFVSTTGDSDIEIEGMLGQGLLHSPGGEKAGEGAQTGSLRSPEFLLNRDFVHFLIGGGGDRRRTVVRLLVDGKPVRSEHGRRAASLRPARFDVRPFRGRTARLEVLDQVAEDWGYVLLDHIVLSQRAKVFGQRNQLLPELESIQAVAEEQELDPGALRRWVEVLDESIAGGANHPLREFTRRVGRGPFETIAATSTSPKGKSLVSTNGVASLNEQLLGDVTEGGFNDWFFDGPAMRRAQIEPGEPMLLDEGTAMGVQTVPVIHSARQSTRLQGSLRSPTFRISHRYVHVFAAGKSSRANLVIENFNLIRSPIYGGLKKNINHSEARWITFDLEMWQGHEAYLELKDTSPGDLAGGPSVYSETAWFAVSRVVMSEQARPQTMADVAGGVAWGEFAKAPSLEEALDQAQIDTLSLLSRWGTVGDSDDDETSALTVGELSWLNWLGENELLEREGSGLEDAKQRLARLASDILRPNLVPSMTEGSGLDQPVFVRGNPRMVGEVAARGSLTALAAGNSSNGTGSRRRELADEVVDPENPLTARVYVNRVWHHLFGRGIVSTPDNFGVLGQPPTHPELLDWLAHWFVTDGEWSTKRLIRLLVTSATYRMASQADGFYEASDPTNRYWHKMPVRRLEGEAIRDAILQVSGDLDLEQFGESVPVHLTPFMTGRGRPGRTGPLDGEHRRTIYQEVRRNFLSPMMLAFDAPIPHTTFGQRTVSNVPAQALILMNDDFVIHQAERWSASSLRLNPRLSETQRIDEMYATALGRRPTRRERLAAIEFLHRQRGIHGDVEDVETAVWADLCHVVFNMKEFIFLD